MNHVLESKMTSAAARLRKPLVGRWPWLCAAVVQAAAPVACFATPVASGPAPGPFASKLLAVVLPHISQLQE